MSTKIEKVLIWASNRTDFENRLAAGDIDNESVAFIENTSEIWTQGKYFPCPYTKDQIDDKIDELLAEINTKQDTLVSGTNIKTVNNQSLVGGGNVSITDKQVTANSAVSDNYGHGILLSPSTGSSFTGNPVISGGLYANLSDQGVQLNITRVETSGTAPDDTNCSALVQTGINLKAAANDGLLISTGGTGDAGFGCIAMLDNGNDPLYVCQINATATSDSYHVYHLITLLDSSGNQIFNNITAKQFKLTGGQSNQVLRADGSTTQLGTINGSSIMGTTNFQLAKTSSNNLTLWTGTESEYNAISSKDSNTLYFITES